jgi:hypothetical protein
MSELSRVEQEQESPIEREQATGPLVPRWFMVGFMVLFIPLTLLGAVALGLSVHTQHALTGAVAVLRGSLSSQVESLSTPQAQQAMAVLRGSPVYAFLYCNQQVLQNEVNDPRMARALALRKALIWGDVSVQRQVVRQIADNMDDAGRLAPTFQVTPDMLDVLRKMVEQRRSTPGMTYAEERITAVLEWLAEGQPTPPTGTEKQHLDGLLEQLDKKVYVGTEQEAITELQQEWRKSDSPVARSAADKFAQMLRDKVTSLTPDEAAYVRQEADRYQGLYYGGMTNLAQAALDLLGEILKKDLYLDHPHIYQYLTLLGYQYDPVRSLVEQGAWDLRHIHFTILYLSDFVRTTTINPVMAVATERLTKEEHERQMEEQNTLRRREAVKLLGRIGLDYIAHRDQYTFSVPEKDEFVREHVTHTLEEAADDEAVADLAAPALKTLHEADAQQPADKRLFTSEEGG